MKKLFTVLVFMLLITGIVFLTRCSFFKSAACSMETNGAAAVAVMVAKAGNCAHQDAITADIEKILAGLHVCDKPGTNQKAVGPVCSLVATNAVSLMVNGVVPAAWGCQGGMAAAALQKVVGDACAQVIPF